MGNGLTVDRHTPRHQSKTRIVFAVVGSDFSFPQMVVRQADLIWETGFKAASTS